MSLVPYLERRQQNDMCTQYKHTDKSNNNITHTKHNKLMVFSIFMISLHVILLAQNSAITTYILLLQRAG